MINSHKVFFVSVVFFLLLTISMFSQNTKIDSLKNIVETGTKDTAMVSTLNALSIEILNNENIKGSIHYSEQANQLADQLNYKKGKAYALKNIGLAQYYQGDFLAVLDNWTKSLHTFETIHDTLGIATVVNNLGAVFYSQGNHAKALDYYLRSLSISEKIKDPFRISQALLNIGGLYAEMLNYDKALEYYKKIEKYIPLINEPKITTSYLMGIGEIYFEQALYDDALKYYKEALSNNTNITMRSNILNKLGELELKRGNKEKAINYLNEASQTAKKNNLQLDLIQTLITLGSIYQKGDFDKAIKNYNEAEQLAKELKANDELRDTYEGLLKTYADKGDYKNAFLYQEKFLAQKDSIFNIKTDDKIRGLQFDFDLDKKQNKISLLEKEAKINQLKDSKNKTMTYVSAIVAFLVLLLAFGVLRRYLFMKKTNKIIQLETEKSEKLLLNILPEETAKELKESGKVQAKQFDSVSVMFTDFKEFTRFSHSLSPEELVKSVDFYFSKFDEIMKKYGLEKIKTIGDAYMCAGGLPFPTVDHAEKMAQAAFEIINFIEETKNNKDNIEELEIRIGINTGAVVAGVVGSTKFAYDIWGDTVNVASRMESTSLPGKINISETTYQLLKEKYNCEYRGEIQVKNKGMMKMYFVNNIKTENQKI
ncbi:MAG: tetratricopeptide repeat protein [Flavobacteriaceae bacterium]|nr:tetratricopeptide repeat protein [Flavobacteriaceae bacterium]